MSRRGQGLREPTPTLARGEAAGPAAPSPMRRVATTQLLSRGAVTEGRTLPLPQRSQSLRGDAISVLVSPECEREGRSLPPVTLDRALLACAQKLEFEGEMAHLSQGASDLRTRLYPRPKKSYALSETSSQPSGGPMQAGNSVYFGSPEPEGEAPPSPLRIPCPGGGIT